MKVISILSSIPCRTAPSDKSEMTTQLIFGETATVLEQKDGWSLIRIDHDGYESWAQHKQLTPLTDSEFEKWELIPKTRVGDLFSFLSVNGEKRILPFGSCAPAKTVNWDWLKMKGLKNDSPFQSIRQESEKLMGCPYLWGGRTPLGIDCSGLVQLVFSRGNMALPRDAWQQAEIGETVGFLAEAREGDLAFFDNSAGHITHVGIIVKDDGDFGIIHASGKVRLDRLDHEGIFHTEDKKYTHKLRVIKRQLL